MTNDNRFAVYFSQSWRPRDVDLNVRAWQELADACALLVDAPEEPGANPPYYINRIEELLRRADLFLSVLTYRADNPLRCSPYSLFEIRLAELADLPRLIIYERRTGFRPPQATRPWEMYVPFDRGVREPLPEQHQWAMVILAKIQQWKAWAVAHRRPISYEQPTRATVLADSSPASEALEDCLRQSGYEPVRFDLERQRSGEAFRLLRESGLIIAEFAGTGPLGPKLYAAAHAMGLPAIRMLSSEHGQAELSWILRGDPGGYENDIVVWNKPEDLPALVNPRVSAMFRLSPALRDTDPSDYLQSKRYSQFFVFISHNLKPPHRALVEHIYSRLKSQHVSPFEYQLVNAAGIDWREALKDSLQKTTHFVALLSPDYEQSEACTYELDEMLARGNAVSILPFLTADRAKPNPKLARVQNAPLSGIRSLDPRWWFSG